MLRGGHELPDYSCSNGAAVVPRMSTHSDEQFMRLVAEAPKALSFEMLLALRMLYEQKTASFHALCVGTQSSDESSLRRTLHALV